MTYMYKSQNGLYWRQIFKFTDISCRDFFEGKSLDLFKAIRDYYVSRLPNLPSQFPIAPGKYSAINITAACYNTNRSDDRTEEYLKNDKLHGLQMIENIHNTLMPKGASLPNGVVRIMFRIHNKRDMRGVMVSWQTQIYDSFADGNF